MTITVTNIVAGPFATTGAAQVLGFAFKAFTDVELEVFYVDGDDDVIVDPDDYAVALNEDLAGARAEGGTVTITMAAGRNLYVRADPLFDQAQVWTNQGARLSNLNEALDRATLRLLRLRYDIDRGVAGAEAALAAAQAARDAAEAALAETIQQIADAPNLVGNKVDKAANGGDFSDPSAVLVNLTYVAPGVGAVAEDARAAIRRLAAFPEQYGAAVGTGGDDTVALQKLFTASKNVRFTRGAAYRVSAALVMQTGTRIDGNGATITQLTDNTPIFDGRGAADIEVFDLTAVGKRTDYVHSSGSLALCFRTDAGSDNWNIHHNRFRWFSCAVMLTVASVDRLRFCDNDITGPGLAVNGGCLLAPTTSVNYGIVAKGTSITVCRNTVRDTAQGLFVGLDTIGFQFDGNIIENTLVEHGIYGDTGIKGGTINGNKIKDTILDGIKVQVSNAGNPIEDVEVSHNVLRNIGGNALGAPSSSFPVTVFAKSLSFVGNLVEDCSGYGIIARGVLDSVFQGNVLNRCGDAVRYRSCTAVSFVANVINECQANAFADEASNVDCVIEGNFIYRPGQLGGAGSETLAINLTSGVRTRVRNNTIIGDPAKTRYGIWNNGATDTEISFNVVSNVTETGARLVTGTLARCAGNRFSGALGPMLGLPATPLSGDLSHLGFTGSAAPAAGGPFYLNSFVRNNDVALGEPFGWVCTDGGNPGTWYPVAPIGMVQGAAQADSTAVALADLVTDFNALLAKLRAARVILT
jgi:inosine/xanthosine triphosphate pyrophosphatase family protein